MLQAVIYRHDLKSLNHSATQCFSLQHHICMLCQASKPNFIFWLISEKIHFFKYFSTQSNLSQHIFILLTEKKALLLTNVRMLKKHFAIQICMQSNYLASNLKVFLPPLTVAKETSVAFYSKGERNRAVPQQDTINSYISCYSQSPLRAKHTRMGNSPPMAERAPGCCYNLFILCSVN